MNTYLAIDYGRAKSGLATATTSLAEPLKSISTDKLHQEVSGQIKERSITHIILGLPSGRLEAEVIKLRQALIDQHNIKVTLWDETLSSQEALDSLQHKKRSVRSGPDHHYAAAIFLQDYLDSNPPDS